MAPGGRKGKGSATAEVQYGRCALIGVPEAPAIDALSDEPASNANEFTVLGQHTLSPAEESQLRFQIRQTRTQLEELDRLDAMHAQWGHEAPDASPPIAPSADEEKS